MVACQRSFAGEVPGAELVELVVVEEVGSDSYALSTALTMSMRGEVEAVVELEQNELSYSCLGPS